MRKGEKAIRIFGFAQRTVAADEACEEGESAATDEAGQKVIRYYPMVSVFDIGQTDVTEGTEDPRLIAQPLTGADGFGVIDALTAALKADAWTVERQPLTSGTHGYAQPESRTVVLSDTLAPEQAAKTLIHETAHVFLGHVEDLKEYATHRGLMETEAESVAYVVAGMVGFDTGAYSIGYIAGWSSCDLAMIKSTAARVLATAHRIAAILNTDEDVDAS